MNPIYDQWVEDHGGYEIFRVRGGFIAKNPDDGDCIEDVSCVYLKQRIDERNRRRGLI